MEKTLAGGLLGGTSGDALTVLKKEKKNVFLWPKALSRVDLREEQQ
jgi:hypothetical protein